MKIDCSFPALKRQVRSGSTELQGRAVEEWAERVGVQGD